MNRVDQLIQDLQAPVKTFRIYALEEAISTGNSQELLKALEGRLAKEKDEECRILLPHAINAVKARFEKSGSLKQEFDPSSFSLETFPFQYGKSTAEVRLNLLAALPKTLVSSLGNWVPGVFEREEHPAVAARLIKVFATSWPLARLDVLVRRIFEGYLSVRFAALEALIAVAPFRLEEHFPRLLTQEDPRIHALAIRGMVKVDPEEARNHLDHVLLGQDSARKLAAIQVALFLPFEIAKIPLLKLLASENDVQLLERAGLVLQINPDPEVPFRLLEILKVSRPPKEAVIRDILDGAKQVLQASTMSDEEFPECFENLQEAVDKRSALSLVQAAVTLLDSDDEAERDAIEELLRLNRENAGVLDALEASQMVVSPEAQQRLDTIMAPEVRPVEPTAVNLQESFRAMPPQDQARLLAGLQPTDVEKGKELIPGLLEDAATSVELQVVALRAATRMGLPGFFDLAKQWVDQPSEPLSVAALDYLSLAPEKVFPLLGKYLKGNRPRVRLAAVRILGRQDPVQAVSALTNMLRTTGPNSRKAALACLVNFDFGIIREPLIDFMTSVKDASLLDFVLCLFQNNPHPENLYQLFRLEQAFPEKNRPAIRKIHEESVTLIQNLRILDKTALDQLIAGFPEKWRRTKERLAAPPAYSVRALQGHQASGALGFLQRGFEMVGKWLVPAMALVLLIGTLMVLLPTSEAPPKKVRSGGVMAVSFPITATVKGFIESGDEIVLQTEDGALFQLRRSGDAKSLKSGDRVKAVVRPFRAVEGLIFARFESMERL